MRLKGKVALVTGGTRGIGAAIAAAYAREGAHVILTGTQAAQAQEVAKQLGDQWNASVRGEGLNVASSSETDELVKKIVDKEGRLDILVNNAGTTRDGLLIRMSDADWSQVLSVNLSGAFYAIRAATKPMIRQRSGSIINISSVIGVIGNAGQANYAASKSGLIGLTKSVARELAGRGVRCNAIAPGYIQTRMTEQLSEKVAQALREQIPMQRLGTVEDVAPAAVFLASEEAGYITGQVWVVDGGLVM